MNIHTYTYTYTPAYTYLNIHDVYEDEDRGEGATILYTHIYRCTHTQMQMYIEIFMMLKRTWKEAMG